MGDSTQVVVAPTVLVEEQLQLVKVAVCKLVCVITIKCFYIHYIFMCVLLCEINRGYACFSENDITSYTLCMFCCGEAFKNPRDCAVHLY